MTRKYLQDFIWDLFVTQYNIYDWVVVLVLLRINRVWFKQAVHLERFYLDTDATLGYPMTECYLPHDLMWNLLFYAPPVVFCFAQLRGVLWNSSRASLSAAATEVHAGMLSLFESYATASTFKHMLEHTGKLRPDWLARLATGDETIILDGRESYPSGHTLYPMLTAVLITQYMLGILGVFSRRGGMPGQFAVFLVCMLPIWGAVYVGLDRVNCYDHDYVDSVAGGLIGAACGVLGYHLNFHSCFGDQFTRMAKSRKTAVAGSARCSTTLGGEREHLDHRPLLEDVEG